MHEQIMSSIVFGARFFLLIRMSIEASHLNGRLHPSTSLDNRANRISWSDLAASQRWGYPLHRDRPSRFLWALSTQKHTM